MNAEIQQVSSLVISARKALFDNTEIDFTPNTNVQSIRFLFTPKFLFFKSVNANSVCDWFNICLRRGLKDIKFILPINKENKHLLGFANTSRCAIICYWKNGSISSFHPIWEFDQEKGGCNIIYTEHRVKKNSVTKNLKFSDQTDEFKQTLLDIKKFAIEIEHTCFSDVFHDAYLSLCGEKSIGDDSVPKQIPSEFKNIYYAVDKADVFGAMGSWNDSPPFNAHYKGLDKEYDELSNRLLIQLRYHLIYVTNECWKKDR